eukprot:CAMPEP_0194057688 /NCGR_PEP_ID=MMETSP0009_2-20130614/63979_1 /TAXON_ID=210454 /ORGANISM="Grammatophora oceanica, Strain CCMP 410" /LENGTH=74 /DNA_ID=CAMNT_0038707535 /DNA_START=355 /DNA_END=579 /DNA_ORIENTATION=-
MTDDISEEEETYLSAPDGATSEDTGGQETTTTTATETSSTSEAVLQAGTVASGIVGIALKLAFGGGGEKKEHSS